MGTKEKGQAFLLVLAFLTMGSMLLVPLLRLAATGSKVSEVSTVRVTSLYTLDGATEYIMWKLLYNGWSDEFISDGQQKQIDIVNCGTNVTAVVTMRAIPGRGGMILAGEDVIKPTISVSPSGNISTNYSVLYTYTIRMEQLSSNTTTPLAAIYDILPDDITSYLTASSELRVDGGAWQPFPDPEVVLNKGYLKWPADYDKDTGSDNFSSSSSFLGIEDFEPRQVKELRFKVMGKFNPAGVYCDWVVLKPWNTPSGPQAPVDVGNPANPGECLSDYVIGISKIAAPDFILPGVETDILYTVDLSNNYGSSRSFAKLIDYLPQGFEYVGPTWSSNNLTDQDPRGTGAAIMINGVPRYELVWEIGYEIDPSKKTIASGESITLYFWARATIDVSGGYYNEFFVNLEETGGAGFPTSEIGITVGELANNYSWNQGAVTVPTYDVNSEHDGVILDSNLSMVVDGISISSFNIR